MLAKLLRQFLRPYWPQLCGVIVFQLAQSIASLYLPTLNADIIDNGVAQADTGYIVRIGAVMLAITLLQVVCALIAVYFGAQLAMALGRDLRQSVFRKVGAFSEREVALFGAPSLITRSTNDVQQVQMLVLMTCTLLVSAPILAVGGVIMALRQDLELSWLMAVSIPVLLVVVGLIIARMVPIFRSMQVRIDAVNRILREQLTGIRVVRAFAREAAEQDRFARANADLADTALRSGRLFAIIFPVVMLILNVTSIGVLWFGAFRIEDGSMQVGALTAFLSYLIQILSAVMMATFMAILLPRAAVSADRIGAVLTTESTVVLAPEPVTELVGHGTVVLQNVSYSYPGASDPVLRSLSFSAVAGGFTAIVGSTGAGKSTLVSLIPRLFDATVGSVVVDGVDVRALDPDLLWSRIGLVPQKPYLFSGTVASNLRYGKPDATEDELWHALDVAQARGFVEAMPLGLESPIAQGGTNVSGGQRQRLAIARALIKRAEIYIFDDSFSALDTATDARLREALRRDLADSTMIVVAQRVATIVDADQILVMEDGAIVARGSHSDLLESSATYAEIVSSQLAVEDSR